jgi:hypothetical protein
MAQEATMSATINNLESLLCVVTKVEEYDSRELAQLSQMSIDQIELSLAIHGLGSFMCRENAVLLKSLTVKYLDLQKANTTNANNQSHETLNKQDEFRVFPNLPLELRRIIWKHALPGSQVIDLYRYSRYTEGFDGLEVAPSSQRPLVRLMKACHEAYEVVRSHYHPINPRAFGVKRSSPGAILLMDPNLDIVNLDGREAALSFLDDLHVPTHLGAQELAKIQSLAVDYDTFYNITKADSVQDLKPLKSLKKIFVTVEEESRLLQPDVSTSFFDRRKWPVRLSTLTTDDSREYEASERDIEQMWKAALRNHSGLTSLASIQVERATLMRDRKDQPPMVCDMIEEEINRLVLLEQMKNVHYRRPYSYERMFQ